MTRGVPLASAGDGCPKCGSSNVGVVDSRSQPRGRVRRRECADCMYRWTTVEVILASDLDTTDLRDAVMRALVLANDLWTMLERARDLLTGVPLPSDAVGDE